MHQTINVYDKTRFGAGYRTGIVTYEADDEDGSIAVDVLVVLDTQRDDDLIASTGSYFIRMDSVPVFAADAVVDPDTIQYATDTARTVLANLANKDLELSGDIRAAEDRLNARITAYAKDIAALEELISTAEGRLANQIANLRVEFIDASQPSQPQPDAPEPERPTEDPSTDPTPDIAPAYQRLNEVVLRGDQGEPWKVSVERVGALLRDDWATLPTVDKARVSRVWVGIIKAVVEHYIDEYADIEIPASEAQESDNTQPIGDSITDLIGAVELALEGAEGAAALRWTEAKTKLEEARAFAKQAATGVAG